MGSICINSSFSGFGNGEQKFCGLRLGGNCDGELKMQNYQDSQFKIFDNLHKNKLLQIKRLHWALALAEEVGEVEKEIKKNQIFGSQDDVETASKLKEELGDVLLCLSMLASYYEINLETIAEASLDKMKQRFTS